MKIFSILILLIITLVNTSYSQSSYEFIIEGVQDQFPGSLLEDDSGNVIFTVNNYQYAEIYKINYEGDFNDSIRILNPENGRCEFFTLLKISDSTFMAFGKYNDEFVNNLWIVSFDFNLNIINDFKMPVEGDVSPLYTYAIVNNKGNVVLAVTYTDTGLLDTEFFFLEITKDCRVIKEKFHDPSGNWLKLIFDLIQLNPIEYRIVKYGRIEKGDLTYIDLDTNFNIISENLLPYITHPLSYSSIIATNTKIVYSGRINVSNATEGYEMALISTDYNNILIDSAHFGKTDTVDLPGFHNNLDFTTDNLIYYGGSSNLFIYNPYYSSIPSWIMLNKLDTNLNIIWQKYYGGDACYNLWTLLATQDGGCVMAGTRYDYQTQNQERDVYILKVNEDGLITWVQNIPKVTKDILIYPNPGSDYIKISSIKDDLIFHLTGISGISVLEKSFDKSVQINTQSLKPGIYLYSILQKNKLVKSGKWVKN